MGTHIKMTAMLVILIMGLNNGFSFWSHLGCSADETPIFLAINVKVSFRVASEEINKNAVILFWWMSIKRISL